MVVSETNTGGGHCGGPTWANLPTPLVLGAPSVLPSCEDAEVSKQNDWLHSRAQQQLLWDTLESLKDKAAQAFLPIGVGQLLDPFRETYSDGGLFGAGCNYAVGLHGIQGRQPKCEDYVLHLALGPGLFAPFNDCSRACLACVLDGHGGTGAVQYVAERFPSYLLGDLPRLRAQPAAAMRSALHRIDEELTALGHNSGTTVNALLMVDNRITVVNTGDCRCILYDWVDERAVQVTHDHNLHSSKERERVLGEGAELSGCGGYVVLPCPTDGSKLLGVTKALGHAGVKALQRSFTMSSLSGILEADASGVMGSCGLQQQESASLEVPVGVQPSSLVRGAMMSGGVAAAVASGPSYSSLSNSSICSDRSTVGGPGTAAAGGGGGGGAASGSGMSEDFPMLLPTGVNSGAGVSLDVELCLLSSGLMDACQLPLQAGRPGAPCNDICGALAAVTAATTPAHSLCLAATPPQRCSSNGDLHRHQNHNQHNCNCNTGFASVAAAATVVAAVAACPPVVLPAAAAGTGVGSVTAPSGGCLAPLCSSSGGFMLTCEPDEFEFTVEDDRHLILLGCDGVFDCMNNGEACRTAVRTLTASSSCTDAAREVAHRACRLGSLDNITALVLRFGRKPVVRKQSLSVLRRSHSNMSGDLAASGGSATSRA